MENGLSMQMLMIIGYSLPELLACGIALAMLWSVAQPGPPRRLALWGIALMLGCVVLQLGIGVYQTWVLGNMQSDTALNVDRLFKVLSGARMLVNCISLSGLVMVVWALCQATRAQRTASVTR